jgi:5-(carboxyamino)imidazole ribonucleotide mutase
MTNPLPNQSLSKIAVIMGSKSDWDTMKHTVEMLKGWGIEVHTEVVSAHRTPQRLYEFARSAKDSGYSVIIAGAGGAAHLPGMVASMTIVPVLGVPVKSKSLKGLDSLLSIVQMPAGVAVGTLAIGEAGAKNAAWLAAQICAIHDPELRDRLEAARAEVSAKVASEALDFDED